jgi:hypothetical protein
MPFRCIEFNINDAYFFIDNKVSEWILKLFDKEYFHKDAAINIINDDNLKNFYNLNHIDEYVDVD